MKAETTPHRCDYGRVGRRHRTILKFADNGPNSAQMTPNSRKVTGDYTNKLQSWKMETYMPTSRHHSNPSGRCRFKVLVLQQLYNLSDDQIEYQIRDRLSFMRFLDLGVEDRVVDANVVNKPVLGLEVYGMENTVRFSFILFLAIVMGSTTTARLLYAQQNYG